MTFTRALQEAGVDSRASIYGGAKHAFWARPRDADRPPTDETRHARTTVPGVGYHPKHAARAWRAVLDLLDETIGPIRAG
jgi:dienelactone hydrolase